MLSPAPLGLPIQVQHLTSKPTYAGGGSFKTRVLTAARGTPLWSYKHRLLGGRAKSPKVVRPLRTYTHIE